MAEPSFAQLRIFLTIARRGSLSAAAIDLDLTQSAVSHALRNLERQLGAALFERSGRGVHLTETGRKLRPIAQQVLDQLTLFSQTARELGVLQGTVRIASFSSLARHLMPRAMQRLMREHPAISIQLDDEYNERDAVIRAVGQGRADIGLTQLLPGIHLSSRALGDDPYVILAPAVWADEGLWQRPYFHLGGPHDVWLTDALSRLGLAVRPALNLSSEAAILALVSSGLGFTVLPQLSLPELPPQIRLAHLPQPVTRRYGTVTTPGTPGPLVQAVLEALWGVQVSPSL